MGRGFINPTGVHPRVAVRLASRGRINKPRGRAEATITTFELVLALYEHFRHCLTFVYQFAQDDHASQQVTYYWAQSPTRELVVRIRRSSSANFTTRISTVRARAYRYHAHVAATYGKRTYVT